MKRLVRMLHDVRFKTPSLSTSCCPLVHRASTRPRKRAVTADRFNFAVKDQDPQSLARIGRRPRDRLHEPNGMGEGSAAHFVRRLRRCRKDARLSGITSDDVALASSLYL